MPFFYYYDWSYLLLVLPALIFSIWASSRVNSTFRTYSQMRTCRGMTGADAARAVLAANGVSGVRIEHVAGNLTDHYDPKSNVIRLSDSVYAASTPAAIGVAAHEAGHAVQYAQDYGPIKFRAAIVKATNIGSRLSMPLILIGILCMALPMFAALSDFFYYVAVFGVLCFGMCVVFQLVTLPTEYNASRRALKAIESSNLLTAEEQKGAKKVLSAAALTYVAALAVSLTQFLRLLMIVGRRRRN
ncbi:MAG: zinc metallopeptidase [Oscillospiraceae bacterium]|nr:zinc metallopeptidase [Oscillospiraceae bacterium]